MRSDPCHRDRLFPEGTLPDSRDIVARGREGAAASVIGACPFLTENAVASEAEYKRARAAAGEVMLHSQIGYRDPAKTRAAWREIWDRAGERGARVDRYGICLDWSMGFPRAGRERRQRGTGLILPDADAFADLTAQAPVAPHFGDFVLGTPAAVENTVAALGAGSTAIGNLGQYFTFRLPGHDDDIGDTAATLEALALCAAQPVDILVHSNLDDGFAALFTDLACSLGAVLLERHIVDDLIGGTISHCYGHSFSEPGKRLAFQLALARIAPTPGTMVYGNTVAYRGEGIENYAALAGYLAVDIAAQGHAPTGHAVNPVPITEAARIPDIDETVDVVAFAGRMIERAGEGGDPPFDMARAEEVADDLVTGAQRFSSAVLAGLERGGVDTADPFEMLLALRRIGARRLERAFGPGADAPVLRSSTIAALERAAARIADGADEATRAAIAGAGLTICACASDVHEYGKILLTETLDRLGVTVLDAGVHAEPAAVAALARDADAVAISTYNGVALDYLRALTAAMAEAGIDRPVLIGGKLNQIAPGSNTSLPVDVSAQAAEEGAIVCRSMEEIVPHLAALAEAKA